MASTILYSIEIWTYWISQTITGIAIKWFITENKKQLSSSLKDLHLVLGNFHSNFKIDYLPYLDVSLVVRTNKMRQVLHDLQAKKLSSSQKQNSSRRVREKEITQWKTMVNGEKVFELPKIHTNFSHRCKMPS